MFKSHIKGKTIPACIVAFAATALFADMSFDVVSYGATETVLGDNIVSLSYDESGAVTSLIAAPTTEGGTVVVDGDAISFAPDAVCKLSVPGTLVFSNSVFAAGDLFLGEDDSDAELSFSGSLVSSKNHTILFPNRKLADYEPKSSEFKHGNASSCPGFDLLIGHSGKASAECIERGVTASGADRVRVLFQKWRAPHLISVEMELVQQGNDIAGKVLSGYNSTINLLGVDIQKLKKRGVKLRNSTNLVGEQNIADLAASSTVKGYGINQVTLTRRNPIRGFSFAGAVSFSGKITVAKGSHLELADQNATIGKIAGNGTLGISSAKSAQEMYRGFIPVGETASERDFTLAKNRLLSDISSMTAYMHMKKQSSADKPYVDSKGGKYTVDASGDAKAYEIEQIPDDSAGRYRCQFQILLNGKSSNGEKSTFIGGIRLILWQDGKDIKARSNTKYGNFKLLSEGNNPSVGLGNDFDVSPLGEGMTIGVNDTGYCASLRDIVVNFKKSETVINDEDSLVGDTPMALKGNPGGNATNYVKVTHINGIPNGLISVGENSVLNLNVPNVQINGAGINYGNSVFAVATNGLLRATQKNVLASYGQGIRLYGGMCEYGAGLDTFLGASDYIMSDGARVFGSSPKVGFNTTNPIWRVVGNLPSYCDMGIILMDNTSVKDDTVFHLFVDDVTNDDSADFIFNGPLKLWEDSASYNNIGFVKIGDGSVLQNNYSELVRATEIWRGGWIFGANDISRGDQEFILEGSTFLALKDCVSNRLAKLTVNRSAAIRLGEGSCLTLGDLEIAQDAKLSIEGCFGVLEKSVRVTKTLPRSILSKVVCPEAEGWVSQDKEGYLRPMSKAFFISIR